MIRKPSLLVFVLLLCLPISSRAQQLWSGVIDPSRAVNWSNAGATIPTNRTQCGSTISAYSGSASAINTAIANCGANQYVQLGAGTFRLTSGIDFNGKSNVTLRGMGADQTLLVFSGDTNCRGFGSLICMGNTSNPQMPNPNNTTTWTAGYSVGTTTITVGSSAGMSIGNILILDQLDDNSDTGNIYVCATTACTGQGGDAYGRSGRSQQQLVKITAISGNQVTITPGLYMPNWRASQSPGVSWANNNMSGDGVEDLSMDNTNGGAFSSIVMLYVSNCWVKGVRGITANRNHVWQYQTAHSTVRDSYFWGTLNSASQSYGVEEFSTSDNLVENNIFSRIVGGITVNGSDSGSVYAYNFSIDDYYSVSPNWMIPSYIQHEAGIAMDLFEGNDGLGFEGDNIHGTHHMLTAFRNYLYGDSWNNPPKTNNTNLVHLWAFTRYYNIIGNVLGSSYYNTYQHNEPNGSPTDIYTLGNADGESNSPNDPKVLTTLMRWGNYDTVTGAVRWCGNSSDPGWTNICGSVSEVPSGIGLYANPVPSTTNLPPSFYYSSQPSWWPAGTPWPPVGPDVTGGVIPGVGGHANPIPARNCYLSMGGTMVGGNDSTPLTFNASTCYSGQSLPDPPSNLTALPQ